VNGVRGPQVPLVDLGRRAMLSAAAEIEIK